MARLSLAFRAQPVRILRRSAGSTPKQYTAPPAAAAAAADARAGRDSAASPSASLDRAAADRLLELVWPERFRLGAGISLSVLGSGLSLAFPAMIGVMVDVTLSPEAAFVSPNGAAAGLLAIFGGQAVVLTARAQLLAIAGENISASMRTRAFGSLLRQEVRAARGTGRARAGGRAPTLTSPFFPPRSPPAPRARARAHTGGLL
jgi:hypothetical protein